MKFRRGQVDVYSLRRDFRHAIRHTIHPVITWLSARVAPGLQAARLPIDLKLQSLGCTCATGVSALLVWGLRYWTVGSPHIHPLVQFVAHGLLFFRRAIRETRFSLLSFCRFRNQIFSLCLL